MKIHESAENYLETILVLKKTKGQIRSIDIAHELSFSKPSVSIALKKLRESGHIEVDSEGFISLLPSGQATAEAIYQKHRLLSQWLEKMGVAQEIAEADACRIEHIISEESFDAIRSFMENNA